jgi:hypothetical protein
MKVLRQYYRLKEGSSFEKVMDVVNQLPSEAPQVTVSSAQAYFPRVMSSFSSGSLMIITYSRKHSLLSLGHQLA